MRVRLLPYKIGSRSCKALAQELGLLRCNPRFTHFKPRGRDIIINWGSSYWPFTTGTVLNKPVCVRLASNKITALGLMRDAEVSVIPFTLHKPEAAQWLEEGSYVYERHTVNGHGGDGIRVVHSLDDLGPNSVELYTRGIRIRREYRVHIFRGKVIDHVQKRRRFDCMEVSEFIRNHTHGWVFVRQNFERLEEVERQAIAAVKALGLDFGAVDIITEKRSGNVYVLEVNCAPGIEGTSLLAYKTAIKEYLNEARDY